MDIYFITFILSLRKSTLTSSISEFSGNTRAHYLQYALSKITHGNTSNLVPFFYDFTITIKVNMLVNMNIFHIVKVIISQDLYIKIFSLSIISSFLFNFASGFQSIKNEIIKNSSCNIIFIPSRNYPLCSCL